MTTFTPKDWRNATTHEGGGDETTPISAAALEDLETRVTDYVDTPDRTISSLDDAENGLTLLVDNPSGSTNGYGTLKLGNVTSGQTPANAPSIIFFKDGVQRWGLGIDVTAGDQGDFAMLHNNDWSGGSEGDFLYITDEASPGVAIGAAVVDRPTATAAQFTIVNPAGANRPALKVIQSVASTYTTATFYRASSGQTGRLLEFRDGTTDALLGGIEATGAHSIPALNPSITFTGTGIGALNWPLGSSLYEASANQLQMDQSLYVYTNFTARNVFYAEAGTSKISFFNATATTKPTGVAVTAEGIHAALVTLGLIAA